MGSFDFPGSSGSPSCSWPLSPLPRPRPCGPPRQLRVSAPCSNANGTEPCRTIPPGPPALATGVGTIAGENLSLDALAERHQRDQAVLADLSRIDRATLPPAEQLNHDLFRRQLEERLVGVSPWLALGPVGSAQRSPDRGRTRRHPPLRNGPRDFQDWLTRLRAFGTYADQTAALMREGIRRGRTQPRVTMQRVTAQIDAQIVEDPGRKPLLRTVSKDPEGPACRGSRTARRGRPGHGSEHRHPRLPSFPEVLRGGIPSRLPGGTRPLVAAGRRCRLRLLCPPVHHHPADPDQIHRLGLDEVARIVD